MVDFIGIGATRSGSTWLSSCLAAHPEINFSMTKETNFFISSYERKLGFKYYDSFFDASRKGIKGEFSPAYLRHPEIAKDIAGHFPKVKLILLLRNPVDRAWSHYMYVKNGKGLSKSFENFIEEKENDIISDGLYYTHLQEFLKLFPREQLHICFYDDLHEKPVAFLSDVYKFLGVDTAFIPPMVNSKINSSKAHRYRFPLYNRFLTKRNWLKKTRPGFILIKVLKILGVNKLLVSLSKLNDISDKKNHSDQERNLDRRTRARLHNLYIQEIVGIEKLTGRDLSHWQ